MRKLFVLSASVCLAAFTAPAHAQRGGGGGRGFGGPPSNPIIEALDANGDGEISASEISRATAALRKLDANNDGQLSEEETRPQFGGRGGEGGRGGFGGRGGEGGGRGGRVAVVASVDVGVAVEMDAIGTVVGVMVVDPVAAVLAVERRPVW